MCICFLLAMEMGLYAIDLSVSLNPSLKVNSKFGALPICKNCGFSLIGYEVLGSVDFCEIASRHKVTILLQLLWEDSCKFVFLPDQKLSI